MNDEALELKVKMAILGNKLIRMDNPMLHERLISLYREAQKYLKEE